MRPRNVCLLPAPNWELSCYVVAKQEVQNPPDMLITIIMVIMIECEPQSQVSSGMIPWRDGVTVQAI